MEPLNPHLYQHLRTAFGKVRIANAGCLSEVTYSRDHAYRSGRLKATVSGGEEYVVNCPFCNDTRGRLSIHHRWGTYDRRTRDDFLHLAYCFNERCISTREQQKQLYAVVFPTGMYANRYVLPVKPVKPDPAPIRIAMPHSTPLGELAEDHPALQYLRTRGFSPAIHGKLYGIRYCENAITARPQIKEPRLIVPVYGFDRFPPAVEGGKGIVNRKLVGWQARLIGAAPAEKKYLTAYGMRKSQVLYRLVDVLRRPGPVVLVEGVVDAWKVGGNGIAMFGKTISAAQCELVIRELRGRPVVVLLDRDAEHDANSVCEQIARGRRVARDAAPVVVGLVPCGRKDPGECSTAELRSAVQAALAAS